VVEDSAVVSPAKLGAVLLTVGRSDLRWQSLAALETLREVLPVAPDVQLQPLRERIDHRRTDAVQATGCLVRAFGKLAPGVGHGQQHGGARQLLAVVGHQIEWHASALIQYAYDALAVDVDPDLATVPGHSLVHGVVQRFPD